MESQLWVDVCWLLISWPSMMSSETPTATPKGCRGEGGFHGLDTDDRVSPTKLPGSSGVGSDEAIAVEVTKLRRYPHPAVASEDRYRLSPGTPLTPKTLTDGGRPAIESVMLEAFRRATLAGRNDLGRDERLTIVLDLCFSARARRSRVGAPSVPVLVRGATGR